MINYNAALPAMALSGRRGIDVNQWINDVKGNLTALARSMFARGEQGIFLDPNDLTEEKINWRRNLSTETEFRNGLNDSPLNAGKLTPVTFAGLTQGTGIQVDTATNVTYLYKTATYKANTTYTFSCYIRMLDGTAPRLGVSSSDANTDICLVLKGATYQAAVQELGGGLYRAYITVNSSLTSLLFGVVKYQGNSTKPVIVSGFQLEEGSLTAYQPFTDFNSEFLRQFPLHALYQDSSGTIPVTTQGQPVGLILDKSKGLLLGSDLRGTGAAINTGGATAQGDHTYRVVSSGDIQSFTYAGIPIGAVEVDYEILGNPTGSLRIDSSTLSTFIPTTAGRRKVIIYNTRGSVAFVRSTTPTDVTVKVHSVRMVLGNHAYQTVSASRPILQQTPILGNELITNNSVYGNAATASIQYYSLSGQMSPLVAGKTYTITYTVSGYSGSSFVGFAGNNPAGYVQQGHTANGTYTTTQTVTGAGFLNFFTRENTTANLINISVKEVTGYRTDQNYLAFDGVDDFLQTNNIDFTATDKVSLFAGVRKSSDAVLGYLLNLGDYSTQQGVFHVRAPQANAATQVALYAKGTTGAPAIAMSVPSGINFVLSGSAALSTPEIKLKVNAILAASYNLSLGTGNFGNYPLYIGRFNGNASPFTGNLYSLIIVGRLTTDSETVAIEKALAKNTGVTLNV